MGSFVSSPSVFKQEFVSSNLTMVSNGTATIAHGLGRIPELITIEYECTVANEGYSVGDILDMTCSYFAVAGGTFQGASITKDATNLNVRWGNNGSVIIIPNKTTGAGANPVLSSWVARIRAFV